jgi:hypothetical protein
VLNQWWPARVSNGGKESPASQQRGSKGKGEAVRDPDSQRECYFVGVSGPSKKPAAGGYAVAHLPATEAWQMITWPLSSHIIFALATGIACGIVGARYPETLVVFPVMVAMW